MDKLPENAGLFFCNTLLEADETHGDTKFRVPCIQIQGLCLPHCFCMCS